MDKIEFKDVCQFIIENSDNTELMDKINLITFPFTNKYFDLYKKNKPENIGEFNF